MAYLSAAKFEGKESPREKVTASRSILQNHITNSEKKELLDYPTNIV